MTGTNIGPMNTKNHGRFAAHADNHADDLDRDGRSYRAGQQSARSGRYELPGRTPGAGSFTGPARRSGRAMMSRSPPASYSALGAAMRGLRRLPVPSPTDH